MRVMPDQAVLPCVKSYIPSHDEGLDLKRKSIEPAISYVVTHALHLQLTLICLPCSICSFEQNHLCSGKRGLNPYRGRQWRGGKEREGARIIAGTAAVQDAVIRKCIFTNEVSGMVDGRGEESRNGRKGEGGSKARCGREALVARLGSKSWRRRARPA